MGDLEKEGAAVSWLTACMPTVMGLSGTAVLGAGPSGELGAQSRSVSHSSGRNPVTWTIIYCLPRLALTGTWS